MDTPRGRWPPRPRGLTLEARRAATSPVPRRPPRRDRGRGRPAPPPRCAARRRAASRTGRARLERPARRHRQHIELAEATLRRSRARAARRQEREGEAQHRHGAGRVGRAAGHPGAQGATAGDQGQPAQLARQELVDDGDPGGVELARRSRRASPGDAVGLLDERDAEGFQNAQPRSRSRGRPSTPRRRLRGREPARPAARRRDAGARAPDRAGCRARASPLAATLRARPGGSWARMRVSPGGFESTSRNEAASLDDLSHSHPPLRLGSLGADEP